MATRPQMCVLEALRPRPPLTFEPANAPSQGDPQAQKAKPPSQGNSMRLRSLQTWLATHQGE